MPPVCTKFYIHPASLVVIFSYAPSNFPTPPPGNYRTVPKKVQDKCFILLQPISQIQAHLELN